MKRKVVSTVAAAGLALTLSFGLPSQSFAEVSPAEPVMVAAASKVVTITISYRTGENIKSSVPYNTGGWKGTLYPTSKQAVDGGYLVIYSGTVTCSGNCAVPQTVSPK
ncbi:hypothetical protein NCCP2716_08730 [Sporosarcina sp. NCCP-2716]|uniref:hypothetical protein n=1 Tax=Sporosarcina sp. NCCP-2716 TaxID=2943679 RepID=UPI002040784D|nr:hypothetical protein [Sporosarcina sp. NCCP-2716]GKV68375.1 hypothetical protein NCCP2716_08730 [Sporosarcina sp. NCCP-2716]